MPRFGYARVSMTDQDLRRQRDDLERAGCSVIYEEAVAGSSLQGREELRNLMSLLHAGDELVVTRVDRLARSIGELQNIVRELQARKIALLTTEHPIDTSAANGKAFIEMLGVFAEFETNHRKERLMGRTAKEEVDLIQSRARRSKTASKIKALHDSGKRPGEIARAVGVSRQTVWRSLKGKS
ncbi:MAG: recombinase family protein [Jannaschia sp.]